MDSNGANANKKKPYYRNVDDTLEDVGITRRQLGYWRKQGLFHPELGPGAKNFTVDDTEQLRFLKRLIGDLGLPVATVSRLMDSIDVAGLWSGAWRMHTFIDTKTGTIVFPYEAMHGLLMNEIEGAPPELRTKYLMALVLEHLRSTAASSATYEIYEARKTALLDQLERLDLLARLSQDRYTDEYVLRPKRESDPYLSEELIDQLTSERDRMKKEAIWFNLDDS